MSTATFKMRFGHTCAFSHGILSFKAYMCGFEKKPLTIPSEMGNPLPLKNN